MKKKSILVVILLIYAIIAFFNVGYNTANIVPEVKNWYFLSDTQKRYKIFGDIYNFLIFVSKNVNDNKVFIYSTDVKTHYLGMYTLYPLRIDDTNSKKYLTAVANSKKYMFIATYNTALISPYYIQTAMYIADDSSNFGVIYKRK